MNFRVFVQLLLRLGAVYLSIGLVSTVLLILVQIAQLSGNYHFEEHIYELISVAAMAAIIYLLVVKTEAIATAFKLDSISENESIPLNEQLFFQRALIIIGLYQIITALPLLIYDSINSTSQLYFPLSRIIIGFVVIIKRGVLASYFNKLENNI